MMNILTKILLYRNKSKNKNFNETKICVDWCDCYVQFDPLLRQLRDQLNFRQYIKAMITITEMFKLLTELQLWLLNNQFKNFN